METSNTWSDIMEAFAPICGEDRAKTGAHKRTGHAEAEDALVLLHQPLQQRALPGSGGAAQHHGPRSRHGCDSEVETGILRAKGDERSAASRKETFLFGRLSVQGQQRSS